MDQSVDDKKIEDDDAVVEFIDPFTVQVLQQHRMKSDSSVQLYDKAIPEIFDLLCTDMEVDGHVHQTEAMEAIGPLLQVDQEVSQTAEHYESPMQLEVMEAIKPLLQIDEQIHNRTRGTTDARAEQTHSETFCPSKITSLALKYTFSINYIRSVTSNASHTNPVRNTLNSSSKLRINFGTNQIV